jgi:hypothetical protein
MYVGNEEWWVEANGCERDVVGVGVVGVGVTVALFGSKCI